MKEYLIPTEWFEPTQPNPTERNNKSTKGDCVIIAFSIALGISWLAAYDLLAERARRTFNVCNDKKNYAGWLKEKGYKQVDIWKSSSKRHTAESFAQYHPDGSYILRVANHLTSCVNGKIRDTWNCGDKSVYMAWEIK